MNIMLLLEMAAGAAPDRLALGERADGLSYEHLYDLAGRAAAEFQGLGVERVVYAAESSPALPVALFGAAWAGMPFVPVNYRLADDRLRLIASRQVPAVLLCDAGTEHRFAGIDGLTLVTVGGFLTGITGLEPLAPEWSQDPEDIAVLLHTSGTSGEPKAAVLRHRHLSNYVLGSVEFLAASEDEASLVSVPPYHIAGISAILTSVYGGRRLVQLPSFSPDEWVSIARREGITHAMTVPTMLSRILDELDPATNGDGAGLPSVRHLSYGGGRMPVPVIARALSLLPGVDFVNAYGLTETSSSIAVLTPTTIVKRWPAMIRTCAIVSVRSASHCHPWRSRSAAATARWSRRTPAARSGCGASRCRASITERRTAGLVKAGSPPMTRGTSTTAATSTSRAASTTSSFAVVRTSPPAR